MDNIAYDNFTDVGDSASVSPEQRSTTGAGISVGIICREEGTKGRAVRMFIKGLSWRHLAVGCFFLALLAMVIGISAHFAKRGTTGEDEGCIPPSPRVSMDLLQDHMIMISFAFTRISVKPRTSSLHKRRLCRAYKDCPLDPDFLGLIVFFWPWSPVMENTSSPMYEEAISKAEYWVTKIFQTSSLSSCIRSAATEMTGLAGNILVVLKLYVSCDSVAEIEVNRAYIEGHSLLQTTQDESCIVNISKNIFLEKGRKNYITDPVLPSDIPDTICGQSQLYPVPKIVGGRPVNRGQYPWVVKLNIGTDSGIYLCGGTIWDYNHILTAAHCIRKLPRNSSTGLVDTRSIEVVAGKWESESNLFPYEQQRSVASGRIHTDYNDIDLANDIALLKLAQPLQPSQLVMKICHPDANTQFPKKGIVAGWGKMKAGLDKFPEVQQSVELTLLDQSDCKKQLLLINLILYEKLNFLANGTLCAMDDDLEERDSCQGDSGGPLFANLGTGGTDRYTILGVVSYGDGCGEKLNPGVYASVRYYLDWIQNAIQLLG